MYAVIFYRTAPERDVLSPVDVMVERVQSIDDEVEEEGPYGDGFSVWFSIQEPLPAAYGEDLDAIEEAVRANGGDVFANVLHSFRVENGI